MTAINENICYVIQFLNSPYKGIDKYVSVPNSWVAKHRAIEGCVNVAYPREDPAKTRERVENNETYDNNWDEYLAIVKYKSVDLSDADKWVETINDDKQSGNGQLETVDAENHDLSNGAKTFFERNNRVRPALDIEAHSNVPGTSSSSASKVNYRPHITVEPFTANQHNSMEVSLKRKVTLDHRRHVSEKRSRVLNMAEPEGNISNNTPGCSNHESYAKKVVGEKCQVENVSDQGGYLQFNPENIRSVTQQGHFLNQCSQSDEHQQQIPVVSKEYLHQNGRQRETPGSSTVMKGRDQRSCPPTIQHDSSAVEALRSLRDLKSRTYEQVNKISSSVVNDDHSHHQQYTTNQINRTKKMNCINQCTQHVATDTISPLQNSKKLINHFRQHTEHSRGKQLPPNCKDSLLNLLSRINEATTENAEIKSQTPSAQNIMKDIQPEGQNLLNEDIQPCQVYEQSHKNLHTSTFNIQLNSHRNKINIRKITECSNQIPKNTLPIVQNSANAVQSPHQLSARLLEQRFQPQMVVRTTGGNPINLRSNYQNNTKNNTYDMHLPLQQLSNPENQTSQMGIFSNHNNLTASTNNSEQNSRLQNSCSQRFLSVESSASDFTEPALINARNVSNQFSNQKSIVRGVLLQDPSTGALYIRSSNKLNNYEDVDFIPHVTVNNSPLAMQNLPTSSNQPNNIYECSNYQPYSSIFENNALQPPSLQDSSKRELFFIPSNKSNNCDKRAFNEGCTVNASSLFAAQNHPNLENQTGNFSERSKFQPFVHGNFPHQDSTLQEKSVRTPTVNDPDQSTENVPVNTPSIVQSSYSSNCCKCSHRKPVSSLVQKLSGKDLRKTNVEPFTIDNGSNNGLFSEMNIRNHMPPTIQKSLNIRSIEYPREAQISLNNAGSSNYKYTHEVPDRIGVNHNCTEKIIHSENILENMQPAIKNSTDEQCLPIYIDFSDKDISSKEISDKELNIANRDRHITTDSSSTSTQISLNEANQKLDVKAVAALLGKMVALFEEMSSTSEIEKISSDVIKNNEILTKVTKKLNDHIKSKIEEDRQVNFTASTSKDNTNTKNKQTLKKNNNIFSKINDDADNGKKVHGHDDDDRDKSTNLNHRKYKVPKKKRGHKRSFVLPTEYNPENSKWTLKHKKALPGLVELMPHSRVYVNSRRLANCKRLAKDCKTMGQLLLTEIFSLNALSVCSWTGAKAKAFCHDDSYVRPGLDKHARDVLLKFTEEYGAKSGWCVFDSQSVLNSIRSKLQKIRKHDATVQY